MRLDLKKMWRSLWKARDDRLTQAELAAAVVALREHVERMPLIGREPVAGAEAALTKLEQQLEERRLIEDAKVW